MIKSHNKKVINKDVKELKPFSSRGKSKCPLNGWCQVTNVIYKCTALSPEKPNKVYLATVEDGFKKRFYIHKKLFGLTAKLAQVIPPFQNKGKETSNSNPTKV